MTDIWNYFLNSLPITIPMLWAFLRLQRRLTIMETDLKWIKGNCIKCPPHSVENSP